MLSTTTFQPFLRFWKQMGWSDPEGETFVFQPFLRFWNAVIDALDDLYNMIQFQPFLRFWYVQMDILTIREMEWQVSTLLEILGRSVRKRRRRSVKKFQPFLRFWGLCVWLLWVFKFFFGFSAVGLKPRFTFISFGVG